MAEKKKQVKKDKGQPRKFKTKKEFEDAAIRYLADCIEKQRFANISGFAVFCHMNRDTFYAQEGYYSDTYALVNDMLEDEALQHNTQTARMYLMNKFNYSDRQKIEHNVTAKLEDFIN